MENLLAGNLGTIDAPPGVSEYGTDVGGIALLIVNIIKLLVVIAGIYTVFNLILAGYGYLSAGGDPKKVADASAKIWQSLIGLLIAAGGFVIGMIISQILFGNTEAMFIIQVFGPGS